MLLGWPFQSENPSRFSILKKKAMSLLCVPFPSSETPLREKPGGNGEERERPCYSGSKGPAQSGQAAQALGPFPLLASCLIAQCHYDEAMSLPG